MPYLAIILMFISTWSSLSWSVESSNSKVDVPGGFDIKADVSETFRIKNQRIRGCCLHLDNAGVIGPATNIMLVCSPVLSHGGNPSEPVKNAVHVEVHSNGQFCDEVHVLYNTYQTMMSDGDGHQVLRSSTNAFATTIKVVSKDNRATIGKFTVSINPPPYYLILIADGDMATEVTVLPEALRFEGASPTGGYEGAVPKQQPPLPPPPTNHPADGKR